MVYITCREKRSIDNTHTLYSRLSVLANKYPNFSAVTDLFLTKSLPPIALIVTRCYPNFHCNQHSGKHSVVDIKSRLEYPRNNGLQVLIPKTCLLSKQNQLLLISESLVSNIWCTLCLNYASQPICLSSLDKKRTLLEMTFSH